MEKFDYINALLLNKFALAIILLMVFLAISTVPGVPTNTPLTDPL